MKNNEATAETEMTLEQIRQDLDDVAAGRLPRHALATESLSRYIPQRDEAGNPDLRKPRIQVPIRCDCPQEWWDTDPRQHRRECPLISVFLYDGGARNLRG